MVGDEAPANANKIKGKLVLTRFGKFMASLLAAINQAYALQTGKHQKISPRLRQSIDSPLISISRMASRRNHNSLKLSSHRRVTQIATIAPNPAAAPSRIEPEVSTPSDPYVASFVS